MKVIGHGVDLSQISAIKTQIDSDAIQWIDRFCSSSEQSIADEPPNHYRFYAGRFAAKEAVVKALGTGFAGDITWEGIEILRNEDGAPYVRLSGAVCEFARCRGISEFLVSISYSTDLAFASVIALGATSSD